MVSIRLAFVSGLSSFLISLMAVAEENVVMTRAGTHECSASQRQDWERVRDISQGIAGRDPVGDRIGPSAAYRRWVGKNWYPLDVYKQTLCGVLHHFNFYNAWSSGDEADWNNFIVPAAPYAYLIEDAKPLMELYPNTQTLDPLDTLDQWHDCTVKGKPSENNCLEAEITPDEHFYENLWFRRSSDSSPLQGNGMCTYGPWVFEEAHGNRPEIHPSELYWWREQVDRGPFFLMVVQDDSNRFDNRGHFDVSGVPPGWWHPWAAFPRTAEFKIAFQANVQAPELFFDIRTLASRNVVTADDPLVAKDDDDGRQHAIEYDDRVVLTVTERQARDEDVGVRFVDVCRNAGNTHIQGYLTITTKVGKGADGGEGYEVLRVDRRESDRKVRNVTVTITEIKRREGKGGVSLIVTGNGTTRQFRTGNLPVNGRVSTNLKLSKELDPLETFKLDLTMRTGGGIGRTNIMIRNEVGLVSGTATAHIARARPAPGSNPQGEAKILDFFDIVYRIAVDELGPLIPEVVIPERTVSIEMVKPSLRRVITGGKPQLVGDFRIKVVPDNKAAAASHSVFKAGFIQGTTRSVLGFTTDSVSRGGTARKMPVLSGGTLEVRMRSGDIVRASFPAIALAPSVQSVQARNPVVDPGAWAAIAEALGANRSTPAPTTVTRVREWELEVAPRYAPVRAGHVAREDDAPVAEALNEVLRDGTDERVRALFGSDRPVTTSWSFKAANLLTQTEVPVKVGALAMPTDAQVTIMSGTAENTKIRVTFPERPENAVFELVAIATVKDSFGIAGQVKHTFSSHALTAANDEVLVDGAIRAAARLAKIPETEVLSNSLLEMKSGGDPLRSEGLRRARTLRLMTMYAASEGITTRELRMLVAAAQRLQAP